QRLRERRGPPGSQDPPAFPLELLANELGRLRARAAWRAARDAHAGAGAAAVQELDLNVGGERHLCLGEVATRKGVRPSRPTDRVEKRGRMPRERPGKPRQILRRDAVGRVLRSQPEQDPRPGPPYAPERVAEA